ncbi:predicted protein [Histoplasma mississippiense (nom. inval.)]|uniref:predicted protein n=1 Tax=Ajellomyces capsulatus (strain NAm1 / WU24) TaxID=2059318 RepID=UPI000157C7BA|nr:predicted protein [Histoplasma mississippiense (nom. inval.)]EDN08181.1 predicted protein [Histoplasma mississippiense (nom. inval.)]
MQAPPAPPSFNTPPERPGHEDLRELYPAPSDAEAVDDHAPPSSTRTPPNSPGVEILREKFIKTKAKSPVKKATLELGDLAAPKACEDNDRTPFISRGELKDLLVAVLADLKSNPSAAQSTKDTGTNPADSEEDKEKEKDTRVRASRREYKVVNEVWDSKKYEYKITDSPPAQDISELDKYAFIVRKRIHQKTEAISTYIDVKSTGLRNILRAILKNNTTADLGVDKPVIEQNLLFHFLPELKEYSSPCAAQDNQDVEAEAMAHRDLLLQHLMKVFQPTLERLASSRRDRKIAFDLLWAFFKPGALIYVTCPWTSLPRCIRYSFGEEKITPKGTIFEVHGHYLDFDGDVFGESTEIVQINKFRGATLVENLPAYPLEYHADPAIKSRLVSNGQKFVSLMGSHHCQYRGTSFIQRKDGMLKYPVDSKIVVDAKVFREMNPNYGRLESKRPHMVDMFGTVLETESVDRIGCRNLDPSQMLEDDLALCSPTVLAFSLNDKIWGEFAVVAVEDVEPSSFSNTAFNLLTLPKDKKEVIQSLTESRVNISSFDDVIEGKGQGVIILLHGPPGVGKTLTAEAVAERLERPLYSIASKWKAVLLLDEADVFLQQRDNLHLERNRLVAIFLRTLEYYRGIFFLTTNLLQDFDQAILDRIHLKLQYHDFDPSARLDIFNHFLRKAGANVDEQELEKFVQIGLNGRQILMGGQRIGCYNTSGSSNTEEADNKATIISPVAGSEEQTFISNTSLHRGGEVQVHR